MWRALLLVAALGACGDNKQPAKDDAGPPIDAAIDAGPMAVGPCLDRPDESTKVPGGQLPCELISPGFQP